MTSTTTPDPSGPPSPDGAPGAPGAPGAGPAADTTIPRSLKVLLGALLVSAFVVILNETIMSVALPRLMEDLELTAATAQWLTTAYMLTMAVVIPTTGLLLQRFTTRAVYVTAMTTFSVGTLVAAIAPGFEVLLAGRIIQASGTAIMMPLLMTTVLTFVPAARRGTTMGLISIVIAVAPAIGPTVSGLILSQLSWRWMFWIVLPIALIALAIGARLVRNVGTPRPVRFDVVSIVLSALAFGGLVYGLASIGEAAEGSAPVPVAVPITVGVLALAAFIVRQLVLAPQGRALLDLRTFASRPFATAIILVAVSMAALFGSLILLPIYLQNVRGMGTLETGLALLPGGVLMGIVSPIVGMLFDKIGPRPLVLPGSVVVALALWGFTLLDVDTSLTQVVANHMVLNLGLAFMFTPLLTSALGSLRPELYSHGSATVGTVQQLAGAAGTALFVTLMTTGTRRSLEDGMPLVEAQAAGIHTAFLCGAIIALVSVGLSLLVRRPPVAVDVPLH